MSYDFQPAPPYKPNPPQRGPHYQAVVDNALRWLADNQPTPDGIRSVLHDYQALCKILYRDGRDILGFNDAHKILTEVAAGRLNPAAVKEAADRERERADLRTIAERIKAEHKPLTAAQRGARAEGGRAKAQLSPDQIKIIVAEFSFIRNKSDRRRGEIVAQRCASGRWTHGEPPRKVTRKDGKPITGRYVQDVVKGFRATHG